MYVQFTSCVYGAGNIKHWSIIAIKQVHAYNTDQVISNYWEPLCENVFTISDTWFFCFEEDEEGLYRLHVRSKLCQEKFNASLHGINIYEIAFSTSYWIWIYFFKHFFLANWWMYNGWLTVTFSDICKVKLENDIVIPLKRKSYRRYVDMFNRIKFNANYILLKEWTMSTTQKANFSTH